jgi:hypothetical protein
LVHPAAVAIVDPTKKDVQIQAIIVHERPGGAQVQVIATLFQKKPGLRASRTRGRC